MLWPFIYPFIHSGLFHTGLFVIWKLTFLSWEMCHTLIRQICGGTMCLWKTCALSVLFVFALFVGRFLCLRSGKETGHGALAWHALLIFKMAVPEIQIWGANWEIMPLKWAWGSSHILSVSLFISTLPAFHPCLFLIVQSVRSRTFLSFHLELSKPSTFISCLRLATIKSAYHQNNLM